MKIKCLLALLLTSLTCLGQNNLESLHISNIPSGSTFTAKKDIYVAPNQLYFFANERSLRSEEIKFIVDNIIELNDLVRQFAVEEYEVIPGEHNTVDCALKSDRTNEFRVISKGRTFFFEQDYYPLRRWLKLVNEVGQEEGAAMSLRCTLKIKVKTIDVFGYEDEVWYSTSTRSAESVIPSSNFFTIEKVSELLFDHFEINVINNPAPF